ncbi:hypothetical protein F5887DRAFT_1159326 [Amanita rubescens]|nr:hypothetical protein F5887DRAFT_1159326 [Amanita rubescens]
MKEAANRSFRKPISLLTRRRPRQTSFRPWPGPDQHGCFCAGRSGAGRVGGVFEDAGGERHLIALYAGALGESAVERYALFLVSLRLEMKVWELMERNRRTQTSVAASARTWVGCEPRCGLWTRLLSEATYATALEQACVVLRFFLVSGRLKLAHSVLDMLPAELAGISEPEERATKYLHYRHFFLALGIDMDMSRIGSIGASRETRAAWLSDYHAVLEEANEQVTRLLTAKWLVNTKDYSADPADKRRKEMIRVRRVFIPELLIRLHSLLYASRKWFPENLKRALSLANIVADS